MNVLIVDDESNLRRMLRALLESEGYRVLEAGSGSEALQSIGDEPPEVVLLDLAMPGMDGLETLSAILSEQPGLPVIMMSGQASLADAVAATRKGAFHFLEKPLTPEAVLLTIRNALEVSRARGLSRALRDEIGPWAQLVGESPAMQALKEQIRKVGPTDARVLITGESGTGKELAAAAIHGLSARKGGPFVRVNSAAIPADLVESEMFGHEKGAFTGATERRRGRFELAHEGTLFLDEIADLGPGAQAKLLRAMESGRFERVGGTATMEVDVRIVAATNRDLRREVEAGRFREDLLFRLEVIPLHIPPLRERKEDVRPLLEHARERLKHRRGLAPVRFTDEAVEALVDHDWPGNVRELLNLVERFTILHGSADVDADAVHSVLRPGAHGAVAGAAARATSGATMSASNSADETGGDAAAGSSAASDRGTAPDPGASEDSLTERLEAFERALIQHALEQSGGNVAEAGRILRTDRANLYRRMKRLGMRDSSNERSRT